MTCHSYDLRPAALERRSVFERRIQRLQECIRPLPCPPTNALKIMQMEGLPVESDQ